MSARWSTSSVPARKSQPLESIFHPEASCASTPSRKTGLLGSPRNALTFTHTFFLPVNKTKTLLSVFQPTKFSWVSPTQRFPEWTGQCLVWTSEGLEVLLVEERTIEYADGTPADWQEITAWAEVEKPSPTHLVVKAILEY